LQPPFAHTPASLANLEAALSADRFATYVAAVSGDHTRALALYEWNGAASAAFYFPLQVVEVALRNACHRELVKIFGPAWHDEPRFLGIDPETADSIEKARKRLRRMKLALDTPHLIAELVFGFWTNLFGHRFDRAIWVRGLHRAFPRFRRVTGRALARPVIARRFDYLRALRNRIAHHEPVFTRSLASDYASLLEVADWMYPDLRAWIASVSAVPTLLTARPPIVS
jgi:hypothetical protein